MTDTSALRAFIEARLAEDERLALSSTPGHPDWQAFTMDDVAGASVYDDQWLLLSGNWYDHNKAMSSKPGATGPAYIDTDDVMAHAARHDPARVLREVAAKRAILQRYEIAGIGAEATAGTVLAGASRLRMATLDDVLLALASVWSDHESYRAEWSTA